MQSWRWPNEFPEPLDDCDDYLHVANVPNEDEVRDEVQSLKYSKAPGRDEITAELLKLGG